MIIKCRFCKIEFSSGHYLQCPKCIHKELQRGRFSIDSLGHSAGKLCAGKDTADFNVDVRV